MRAIRRCRRLQIVPRSRPRSGRRAGNSSSPPYHKPLRQAAAPPRHSPRLQKERRCTCALILARALARPSEVLSQRPSPGPGTTMGCLVNCRARGDHRKHARHEPGHSASVAHRMGCVAGRGPPGRSRPRRRCTRRAGRARRRERRRLPSWTAPTAAPRVDGLLGLFWKVFRSRTSYLHCIYLSITVRIPSAECHLRTLSPPGRRKAGSRWLGRTSPRSM